MKKIMSITLAILMLISAMPITLAVGEEQCDHGNDCPECYMCIDCGRCVCEPDEPVVNPDHGNYGDGTKVEYEADDQDGDGQLDNLYYTVTVPAKLNPGQSGVVTLKGMWPSNTSVKVTSENLVDLVNNINNQDVKTLAVTFAGIHKAGDNEYEKTYTENVAVANIEGALFGTWSGVFEYQAEIVDNVELISFTLTHDISEDKTYFAESGMTWKEWANSEYNTSTTDDCYLGEKIGYFVSQYDNLEYAGCRTDEIQQDGTAILADEVIVPDAHYQIIHK